MDEQPKTLYAISFDGVAISGVIAEFLKIAGCFRKRNFRILLDLGYDIKTDKNNFFRPYDQETAYLPDWVQLYRPSLQTINDYHPETVHNLFEQLFKKNTPLSPALQQTAEHLSRKIADVLIDQWQRHNVRFIVVENGTLPENVIYTRALYQAIERYGNQQQLGKFVFWRDHDLMWWSEPGKYGPPPFIHTPKAVNSPYIHYIVLHQPAKQAMQDWAELRHITVLPNHYPFAPLDQPNNDFLGYYHIPKDSPLISRCTRIIPQKRINRDIRLLAELNNRYHGDQPRPYLFVAGDLDEHPDEARHLRHYAESLGIEKQVIFGGPMLHYDEQLQDTQNRHCFSVKDILACSTLNSFLTSYDYEGFGNPVGESIASGIPYTSSRYELYDAIYGHRGFQGPILEMDASGRSIMDRYYIDRIYHLLSHTEDRRQLAEDNYRLGVQELSLNSLDRKLQQLFPDHLR